MGGKSFTKAASRLTTPQLEALTVYCQNRLADVFPRTERLRCVRSKDSHGDLDLLSAFDRPDIRIGPAQIGISSADVVAVTPAKSASVNAVLCRKFCDEVKEALGAKGWIIASFGYPIIALQVPCTVLEPSSEDEDAFWQVDIALTSSNLFDAYLFSCSYNIVFALLVLAAQTLSPALWLRRDSLSLRHRPFDSQALVEITLIGDRQELYRWFGFDFSRWELGFDDNEDIYNWITDVPADSTLAQAWNKLAAGKMDETKLEYRRFFTRIDGVPEFVSWLQTRWAAAAAQPSFKTPPESVAVPLSPSVLTDRENLLDPFASGMLDRRGQAAQYAVEVQQKRVDLLRIAEAQKRREMNRLKAALEQAAARLRRMNAQVDGVEAPGSKRAGISSKDESSSI